MQTILFFSCSNPFLLLCRLPIVCSQDEEIDEIGKGVDVLRELALAANEEVKIQNKMLDVLEEKVNDVHEHVTSINVQLKETLDKARASDKICMDIFCVMILVGMIIVLYKLSTDARQ